MERSRPPTMSHDDRKHRRMHVVYGRKTRERRIFLDELTSIRQKREKELFRRLIKLIGPNWYQVLSVTQRKSLDTLKASMFQDLLQGTPYKTVDIMNVLGIYPRPNKLDLMKCIYLGRNDPKEMLAQLFLFSFGHSFDLKETHYCYNAKLILSAIYYLGLENLLHLLHERFKPEPQKKIRNIKKRSKDKPPLISPYHEKFTTCLYEPPKKERPKPDPLPNLDALNAPWEPKLPMPKPPPPPPPPPPPKKRLPRSYCDELGGFKILHPYSSNSKLNPPPLNWRQTKQTGIRSMRKRGKLEQSDVRPGYGVSIQTHRKKPRAPSTGIWNMQYEINRVCTVNGRNFFSLGNVTGLTPQGDLIHGGHMLRGNQYINIHNGFRANRPPSTHMPCDCVKKWTGTVFKYVRRTKCYCGHHYDYNNEEEFPKDTLAFYEQPTRHLPGQFNYENIFQLDPKSMQVRKDFKKLWDTDSVLQSNPDLRKPIKKKKISSVTCLGRKPKPVDYLRCALRYMQDENIAAKLPDIHQAPELIEWMRHRIAGPCTRDEKKKKISKSLELWQVLDVYQRKGMGVVYPPQDSSFKGMTNWLNKKSMVKKYNIYTRRYKCKMFLSQAYVTNLFWTTMLHAQFPDKNFRSIFFSYLYNKIDDIQLVYPYTTCNAMDRLRIKLNRPYCCKPDGVEDISTPM